MDAATYAPAALLLALVAALIVVRSRSTGLQICVELGALVAIVLLLADWGASPLRFPAMLGEHADADWLRGLAIAWWLVGARLAVTLTIFLMGRDVHSRQAKLFYDLAAGAIYLSAAYVIANSILDLDIRALLATSGVIAVVLGLALQTTLADLFSGLAVGIEQPFGIDDYVSVGSGVSGTVVQMDWRSVRILTDEDAVATVPNGVVAKGLIVNHSRPTERRSTSLFISLRSRRPAPELIETIKQALLLSPDVLDDPAPAVVVQWFSGGRVRMQADFYVSSSRMLAAARGQALAQSRRLLTRIDDDSAADETLSVLRDVAIFKGLKDADLASLNDLASRRRVRSGETLFQTGTVATSLAVVLSGVLDVRSSEGSGRSLGRVGVGECLGEVSLMSQTPSEVSVIAMTDAELIELTRDALLRVSATDPNLESSLRKRVSRGVDFVQRARAASLISPPPDKPTFRDRVSALFHRRAF